MGGNAVDEKEEILEFDGADLFGGWRYFMFMCKFDHKKGPATILL